MAVSAQSAPPGWEGAEGSRGSALEELKEHQFLAVSLQFQQLNCTVTEF